MDTASPSERALAVAHRVRALLRSRVGALAGGHLVCIDGPGGSGKTTLAGALGHLVPGARVVHTDVLLDGWGGLPGLPALLADLVEPLARGEVSGYRRYDWHAGRYAEWVPVAPGPLLVLEGVGAGTRRLTPYRSALVWVEAAPSVRSARGLARDESLAPYWPAWRRAEAVHFAAEGTRERADLVVRTDDAPEERTVPPPTPPET